MKLVVESQAIKRWEELSLALKSCGTAETYPTFLELFLDHSGLSADEIAQWSAKRAVEEIKRYLGYRKGEGVSDNALLISWYALKSFFKAQGIKIEEEAPIKRPRKRYLDQALSKDDIRQIIEYSPLHIKLAVALESFSEPRPSDCVNLTFYDFLKQPDYIDGPPYLLLIRE